MIDNAPEEGPKVPTTVSSAARYDYQGRSTRELALQLSLQHSSGTGLSIDKIIEDASKIASYLTDGLSSDE